MAEAQAQWPSISFGPHGGIALNHEGGILAGLAGIVTIFCGWQWWKLNKKHSVLLNQRAGIDRLHQSLQNEQEKNKRIQTLERENEQLHNAHKAKDAQINLQATFAIEQGTKIKNLKAARIDDLLASRNGWIEEYPNSI
jgi:hypothetical protein